MSAFVLLTDNDDGTAFIRCRDTEAAESIASAAVLSDGGVSAWLIPGRAIDAKGDIAEKIEQRLRDGGSCGSLAGLPEVAVLVVQSEFNSP